MTDQLALDGLTAPGPRAYTLDDEGRKRCAACHSELRRERCPRCDSVGADALDFDTLELS